MNEVEVRRCTGHCCKDFTLPISPMQMTWWAKLLKLGKKPTYWFMHGRRKLFEMNRGYIRHYNEDEIAKVSEMVIFLREDKHDNAVGVRKGNIGTVYHYTCKYHDAKTGNCMNYENRPGMCRDYPNGRDCRYRGCTRVCQLADICAGPMRKEEHGQSVQP